MDENRFGKGLVCVSVMTDIDNRRVLKATPERTIDAVDKLWETLSETQLSEFTSVSMDMWQTLMTSAGKQVPEAEIVMPGVRRLQRLFTQIVESGI